MKILFMYNVDTQGGKCMKIVKKIIPMLALLSLVGCKGNSNQSSFNSENNYDSDPVSEITSDEGSMPYDGYTVDEDNIEVPTSFDSFVDNEIKTAGKYYLKGDYPFISITAAKDSEVFIFMDGANINSNTGIAFGSSKAILLHLVLLEGSENVIANDFADTNAFHIKGDVRISGSGKLTINSAQKNGLKVSKDLFIFGSVNLDVTGAGSAIAARSIYSNGATIKATASSKDGLQAEADTVTEYTQDFGYVYLLNTNLTVKSHGDAIQADTYAYVSGGTHNYKTECEFIPYSTENMTEYGLETDDFKFVKSGSTYKRVAKDQIRQLTSSYYALSNSAKGIKVGALETSGGDTITGGYNICVAHLAKVTINSMDDCIHTNYGDVTIDSSNFELDSYDDGIHADYNVNVNNASIQINNSYEGLEGSVVTIDGDNTNIVSNSGDDGINAASDLETKNYIHINGGYLRVYAAGDGLDANTALYLNGGTVIVEGPGSGNGSLDADQIYFNGGIVFACSTSGMTERMTAKQNTFVWQGSSISSGKQVRIVNENGDQLFSYTLKQSCNQIIFSHKDLTLNNKYTIYSDSSSLTTITMTSSLTKVGNSQGGGGGGHGH